jgi:uncharacterized protein
MDFINRRDEMAALESRWDRGRGEFYVVWGRRRVGKTELLSHFLEGKRGFLFEATEGLEPDHLVDFSRLLAEKSGKRIYDLQPLTNWPAALAALDEYVSDGPAVVVLDEFQWIARATPDIGSQLNRWWRQHGRNEPIFLILSGSEVSFFEREVLTGTMFGRRTGQQQLAPFGFRDAGLFFPHWTAEDKIRAYAVCGGMPYYLEQFDPAQTLEKNILQAIFYRDGVLHEEARLLLHEELPDAARYFSILRAIANGDTRVNEIVQRTKLSDRIVGEALQLLQSLYLVQRRYPVTVANPDRTRLTYYEITDGYLRFYFKFVVPYEDRLRSSSDAERHFKETVLPQLDHFVSMPAFENVCRQYIQAVENPAAIGPWWGSVQVAPRKTEIRELDAVAIDADASVTSIGTCKWQNQPVGMDEDELLTKLIPYVPKASADVKRFFFSRSGFSTALENLAENEPDRYVLLKPDDLFA